jgi:hypothetical protein
VGAQVIVEDNELLPYCQVCELVDRLESFDGGVSTTDNLKDCCGYDAGLDCDGGFHYDAGPDAACDGSV